MNKVKDLIEALEQYPLDWPVFVGGDAEGNSIKSINGLSEDKDFEVDWDDKYVEERSVIIWPV